MTEPIVEISGARIVQRDDRHEESSRREKRKKREQPGDDSVDISPEARERASGRKKENIMEYIERGD